MFRNLLQNYPAVLPLFDTAPNILRVGFCNIQKNGYICKRKGNKSEICVV